ncbi:MAG: glucokinase, partial [Deltaproteobacteria bacterium]|nr:glucokinase [Deltaproteobacteria bacterium]
GHADFAPRNTVEVGLLAYLMERFGHVSYERVISGPGLKNVHDFLLSGGCVAERIKKRFEKEPPSVVITDEGERKGGDPACVEALNLFVSILGAEAGNLALKSHAVGGVFIGGGIAPSITKTLRGEVFMEAFLDKGRFREFLSKVPVSVLLNPEAALLGGVLFAAAMLPGNPSPPTR